MDKEDNPKTRGFRRLKNKKKYNKAKSVAHAVPPKLKSNPILSSNWDCYDKEDVDKKINSSMDFSLLANVPITRGSHFQFKSDKDIAQEIDIESGKSSSLFTLDLNLLDHSLSTISFHRRCGIIEEYFTKNQQRIMTTIATKKVEDYSSYFEHHHLMGLSDAVFDTKYVSSSNIDSSRSDDLVEVAESNDKPLMKELVQKSNGLEAPEACESDLEQWLDDILDD